MGLVLGGLAAGGIQTNNNLLIRIATLVMIFASIALLLAALLMGISSGAVMDDMGYYYDTNYPKLRAALEKADNSYCQLAKADCETLTYDTVGTAGVYPKRCNDEGKECKDIVITEDSPYWDSATGVAYKMTASEIWNDQYAILAAMARKDITGANAWLAPCKTTGICIYCDDFYKDVKNVDAPYIATAPPETSTCVEKTVAEALAQGLSASTAISNEVDSAACAAAQTAAVCTPILTADASDSGTATACVWTSSAGNCAETAAIMGGESVEADRVLCNAVQSDAELADATACDAVITTATADEADSTCLAKTDGTQGDATNEICTALIANTLGKWSNKADCEANNGCTFVQGKVGACTYKPRSEYLSAPNLDWQEALAGSEWASLVLREDAAASTVTLKNYESAFPYDEDNGFAYGNTCTETATTSVAADATLCDAVVITEDDALDAANCGAVMTTANDDGDAGACTFTKAPMRPSEWTAILNNYTTYQHDAKFAMPKCETALTDCTSSEANCPETPVAAGEYSADCASCNGILTPYSFNLDTGMSLGGQQKCLNFFVGHMENDCGSGDTTCLDEVRPMVDGRASGSCPQGAHRPHHRQGAEWRERLVRLHRHGMQDQDPRHDRGLDVYHRHPGCDLPRLLPWDHLLHRAGHPDLQGWRR